MANYWIPVEDRKPSKSGNYIVTLSGVRGIKRLGYLYYDNLSDEWQQDDGSETYFVRNDITAWMDNPDPYDKDAENYSDQLYYLIYGLRDRLQDALDVESMVTDRSTNDMINIYVNTLRDVYSDLHKHLNLVMNGDNTITCHPDGAIEFCQTEPIRVPTSKEMRMDVLRNCLSDVDVTVSEYNYDTEDEDNYTKVLEQIRMRINDAEKELHEFKDNNNGDT